MSQQENVSRDTIHLRLDQIEKNKWNTNEVRGEKKQRLRKDMEENGQREPITVSPKGIFYGLEDYAPSKDKMEYVICDGSHRYDIGEDLNWETIRAVIEMLTEDEALTKFYRMQSNRGDNNPIKEAELFEYYYTEKKLKEHQIADKFNVSRGYVAQRRQLLRVSPKVQTLFLDPSEALVEAGAPMAELTASHVKALVGLDEADQTRVAMEAILNGKSSKWVEEKAKEIRAKKAERERFMKAWETAVTKDCPLCNSKPKGFHEEDQNTFQCAENFHIYRYDKTPEEVEAEAEAIREEERQKALEERYKYQEKTLLDILERQPDITLDNLYAAYFFQGPFHNKEEACKYVEAYLEEHPDIQVAPEPEPEPVPEPEETASSEAKTAEWYPPKAKYDPNVINLGKEGPVTYLFTLKRFVDRETFTWGYGIAAGGQGGGGPIDSKDELDGVLSRMVNTFWHTEYDKPKPSEKNTRIEIVDNPYYEATELWDILVDNERAKYNERRSSKDELPEDAVEDISKALGGAIPEPLTVAQVQSLGQVVYNLEQAQHNLEQEGLENLFFRHLVSVESLKTVLKTRYLAERNARDELDKQDLESEEEDKEVPDEPTIPVPDHGRDYPDSDGTVLCPHCEKQVPDSNGCAYCGEPLLPGDPEPEDSPLVKQWLDSPIKELRDLRDQLTLEDIEHIREKEERKGALALLDKAQSMIPEPIPAEDD